MGSLTFLKRDKKVVRIVPQTDISLNHLRAHFMSHKVEQGYDQEDPLKSSFGR